MEWYIQSCPYFRRRSGRPPPNRARRPFVGSLIDCEDDCDDQPVQSHHHDTRSRDQYQDKWDELAELRTVTDSNTDKLGELQTVTDSHERRIDDLVRYLGTFQVICEVNLRSYSFYILYCNPRYGTWFCKMSDVPAPTTYFDQFEVQTTYFDQFELPRRSYEMPTSSYEMSTMSYEMPRSSCVTTTTASEDVSFFDLVYYCFVCLSRDHDQYVVKLTYNSQWQTVRDVVRHAGTL